MAYKTKILSHDIDNCIKLTISWFTHCRFCFYLFFKLKSLVFYHHQENVASTVILVTLLSLYAMKTLVLLKYPNLYNFSHAIKTILKSLVVNKADQQSKLLHVFQRIQIFAFASHMPGDNTPECLTLNL